MQASIVMIIMLMALFPTALFAANPETTGTEGEAAYEVTSRGVPDIQWFKDEMRISPKYVETQEGILGMSWLHFVVMVLLAVFALGGLIAYSRQATRTTRILQQLLSEEDR